MKKYKRIHEKCQRSPSLKQFNKKPFRISRQKIVEITEKFEEEEMYWIMRHFAEFYTAKYLSENSKQWGFSWKLNKAKHENLPVSI